MKLIKYCYNIGLNNYILLILISAFLMMAGAIKSQSIVIKGVISEGAGSPMIGVAVLEKNTNNGTITDIDGSYSIKVNSDQAILVFSYLGYKTQEVSARAKSVIDIVMEQDSKILDDIIVTGYRKETRSDVSTSISSIKARDVEKLVVSGVEQALQGQAPGISVTQVTGSPGDDMAVRIRGAGTLGNNNPLFIVDGVPTSGNINMFSVNDIQSIEVLKDGASAAIYGSRASNGVVLITTKRGKSGKTSFSFNVSSGVQTPIRLPKLLNSRDYLTIRNEAITNANTLRNPANKISTYNPSIVDTLPDVNWLDRVFSNAPIRQYSLSAMTGTDNSNIYVSADYQDQDGIFRGQNFKKYQVRINGETGNSWFKVGNNLSFGHTSRKVIGSSGDGYGPGNELSAIRFALIASPVFSGKYPDGSDVKVTSELGDPLLYGDGNANPLVLIDNTDWHIDRSRIFGNVFAEVSITDGIKIRTTLGGDLNFEKEKLFKEYLSAAIYNPTSLNEGRVFNQTLIWNSTASYDKKFGKHKTSALIGTEAISNHTDYLGASANNFRRTDPLFRYLNSSVAVDIKNLGVSGIATEWGLVSYFGLASYNYDNKYLLSAAVRKDGSSRFGKDNRWGIFPSVSAGWIVSNEAFLKELEIISELKLRASWGKLGNQEIGVYPYSSLVSTGDRVYSFNDNIVTGASIQETGNSGIRWESSTQTNLGFDLGLWKDKLTVSTDFFRKVSDDVLVRVPIPQSGGSQRPPFVNAASIENKGMEMAISYRSGGRGFSYNITPNISIVRNKVLSIAGSEPILGGFGLSDGPLTKTEQGRPIGSFFLWDMEGIFQTQEQIDASPFQSKDTRPGDIKFRDINNDKVIDDKDRSQVGNPFPDFTYGMQFGISWKDLDFSILFQGIQGNDVYFLYGNFAYETQSRGFNSYADILNRWTPENTNTNIPKVSLDDRNGNRRPSTRFLYDGSYMRIRNISLGYNLKNLINLSQINSCRVYFTVQNAFTFTKYPGLDPEIQANANDTRGLGLSSDLAVGIDWGTVPAPRTYVAGIKVDF
ncbi:MAG: TonB-dependent receptor [Saprospiraceae bacterium]|jgi:TonB-linked SusC/RagA family outer membrane protein|nr:TonB-dependent receptor [Saprospiraceae bacterium]MBL0023973.1 TonB-dependent receptor [Saprospiraceae bacterium]